MLRIFAILHKRTQHPLGESSPSQLSDIVPTTYEESIAQGGAKSGVLADEIGSPSQSLETRDGASLLDAIRVLTNMPPDERAVLIELLKTWG